MKFQLKMPLGIIISKHLVVGLCVYVLSHFSRVQHFAALWAVALQAPLSVGFSRQEYWTGLPCPLPGDLSDPGVEPTCVMSNLDWQAGSVPIAPLLQQKGHLCDNSFQKRIRRLIKSRIRQQGKLSEGFFH